MPSFQQGQQFTLFKARKHFKSNHTTTGSLFQHNVKPTNPALIAKKDLFSIRNLDCTFPFSRIKRLSLV
jgi:hypothetical protein